MTTKNENNSHDTQLILIDFYLRAFTGGKCKKRDKNPF